MTGVLPLREVADTSVFGSKAVGLGEAVRAGLPVPDGFALSGSTVEEVAAGDEATVESVTSTVRPLGGPLAVRSSAVDEDGDAHSFAGQHETFLNVEGIEAIGEAVVLCFASAFTERALDYRQHVGLPVDHIGLAILVQAQVLADSSAVVFSANPINGRRDEIVINASYGLGESIVGGTTTPDTFVVRKADLEVLSRTIGQKQVMTVPVPGGTRELETPALLRDLPSITDEQILALASLAVALETDGGTPVDVECAIHDATVYLLQSRPITTLRSASGVERGDR